jgi:hypothetical protein
MAADDLVAHAIVTLAHANQWIFGVNITSHDDDALVTRVINAVTARIETHLDRRVIIRSGYIMEYFDGDGTHEHYVRYPPVVELNEIWIGSGTTTVKTYDSTDCADRDHVRYDSALDANSERHPNSERGRIVLVDGYQFLESSAFPDNCYIKYKGGWYKKDNTDGVSGATLTPEIPRDIFQAAAIEVKRFYKLRERQDSNVASKSLGVTGESISYVKDEGLSKEAMDLLEPWRRDFAT